MGVVLGLGSLAWVVLRSTAACQEGRSIQEHAHRVTVLDFLEHLVQENFLSVLRMLIENVIYYLQRT